MLLHGKWSMLLTHATWETLVSLLHHQQLLKEDVSLNDLVQQLNIALKETDVQQWMNKAGPGYEHLDDIAIVDLVLKADVGSRDEYDDQNEIRDYKTEKCLI